MTHYALGYGFQLRWPSKAAFMQPFIYTRLSVSDVGRAVREDIYQRVKDEASRRMAVAEALL